MKATIDFTSGGLIGGPLGIHPEGEEVIAPLDELKRFLSETEAVASIQGVTQDELLAAFKEINVELRKDWAKDG